MDMVIDAAELQAANPEAQAAPSVHEGQGLVEYALIIMLVAVVTVLALGLVGTTINDTYYNRIVTSLTV